MCVEPAFHREKMLWSRRYYQRGSFLISTVNSHKNSIFSPQYEHHFSVTTTSLKATTACLSPIITSVRMRSLPATSYQLNLQVGVGSSA